MEGNYNRVESMYMTLYHITSLSKYFEQQSIMGHILLQERIRTGG